MNGGTLSNALTVSTTAISPGLFTFGSSGTGGAVALNYDAQNGTVSVTPEMGRSTPYSP
jgi:uncharacterized protein (TIGR03437 family)